MLTPSIFLDFADATYLDPRLNFSRASVGSYADRLGAMRYRPAGTPRFWTAPGDGSPRGLLLESAATNLLLWSEDFTNAAWVPTASTVTTNTIVAPDGSTVTGDTVTASGPTAALAQTATITVNNNIAYSVFAKAGVSGFVSISLNDGQNVVSAWFNLLTGVLGSTLLGSGTLTYQWASIQAWGGGWYRCGIQAKSNTITSVAASVSPCAGDRIAPASGNAAYIWGAMLTSEGTTVNTSRQSSYISTTTATVARAADNCPLPYARIDPSAFNQNEGTYFCDFVVPFGTWLSFGGAAFGFTTASGTEYCQTGFAVGQNGIGKSPLLLAVQSNIVAGGVSRAQITNYPAFVFDTPIKIAARYSRAALLGHSVNGLAVVNSAVVPAALPAIPLNFTFGPFNGWGVANALSSIIVRRFMYFPRYLSPDQMQQLTA